MGYSPLACRVGHHRSQLKFSLFLKLILFIYFWLRWVFIAVGGLSLVVVHGLLIAVAFPVEEHGL